MGDVPYLRADPLPGRVGGGLGPVAQAELCQHVPYVVLGRLPGDVEPVADLSVGEPGTDELEDLGLSLGQRADALGADPDGRTSDRSSAPAASACRSAFNRSKSTSADLASAMAASGARCASARAISRRVLASSMGSWARAKPSMASCRQARASPFPLATETRPFASAATALR